MVTNKNEALRSRRLPVDGQQRPQIILVSHARQPGEQVFQESRYLRDSTNPYGLGAVMELNVAGNTCTDCCTRR